MPFTQNLLYCLIGTHPRGRFVFLVKLLCFGEKIDLALVFSLEKCYYNNV